MLHIFGKMIFKKSDTVPQMRSKPIHFHKQAQTHFRANCCRKDKILSIIFVKHFCWDFQTCLSQFFLPTRGPGGPPWRGGPPSAEISRHQPKPAEISHHQPQGGGGGTLSAGKSLAQGGWGQLPGGGAHRAPPHSPSA